MKQFIAFLFILTLVVSGCQDITTSTNQKKEPVPTIDQYEAAWTPSPTFRLNDPYQSEMIGISQKLGIICSHGAFVESVPAKCLWHFWGDRSTMEKASLQIKAVHKETGETVLLFKSVLSPLSAVRGADFSQPSTIRFSKPGLWRMDVYVDDKLFGSIVVKVKKKTSSLNKTKAQPMPNMINRADCYKHEESFLSTG